MMKNSEFEDFIGTLSGAYQDSFAKMDEVTLANVTKVWKMFTADLTYDEAGAALALVLNHRRYPTIPTIGEFREAVATVRIGHQPDAAEAWAGLIAAFGQVLPSTINTVKDKVHPIAWEVAGHIGFEQIWFDWCSNSPSQNRDATRREFERAFTDRMTKYKDRAADIPQVRRIILGGGMKALSAGDEERGMRG